jgi:hypothetical protein
MSGSTPLSGGRTAAAQRRSAACAGVMKPVVPRGTGLGQARQAEQPGAADRSAGACHRFALVRERYADFGPMLACEKLRECHGLVLAKETVRRWLRDAGLSIPRVQS